MWFIPKPKLTFFEIFYFSLASKHCNNSCIIPWSVTYKIYLQPLLIAQNHKELIKAALKKHRRYQSDAIFNKIMLCITMLAYVTMTAYVRTVLIFICKTIQKIYSKTRVVVTIRDSQKIFEYACQDYEELFPLHALIVAHYVFRNLPPTLRPVHPFCETNNEEQRHNNKI